MGLQRLDQLDTPCSARPHGRATLRNPLNSQLRLRMRMWGERGALGVATDYLCGVAQHTRWPSRSRLVASASARPYRRYAFVCGARVHRHAKPEILAAVDGGISPDQHFDAHSAARRNRSSAAGLLRPSVILELAITPCDGSGNHAGPASRFADGLVAQGIFK